MHDCLHDHNARDSSTMSQISRTGLKKSQLEKGLKEAETKAAYWKKKALAYKQASDRCPSTTGSIANL